MTKYINIVLIINYFMNSNLDLEVLFFSTDACLIHLTHVSCLSMISVIWLECYFWT